MRNICGIESLERLLLERHNDVLDTTPNLGVSFRRRRNSGCTNGSQLFPWPVDASSRQSNKSCITETNIVCSRRVTHRGISGNASAWSLWSVPVPLSFALQTVQLTSECLLCLASPLCSMCAGEP
uniref:Uncharacterized protein n=1 Tax=Steinernema glaseri TaxID=37863 RepID=A0A1I7ZPP9_9BILA